MTETIEEFLTEIDRLEARYKGQKHVYAFQVNRELLIAVRNGLRQPSLDIQRESHAEFLWPPDMTHRLRNNGT